MKTVIVPESDLFRKISSDLNRKVHGVGDWKTVAYNLGIPQEDYIQFENCKEKKSPTREVFDRVVVDRPDIAILEIIKALKNIDRYDVIEVITEELGTKNLTQLFQQVDICFWIARNKFLCPALWKRSGWKHTSPRMTMTITVTMTMKMLWHW